MLFFSHSGNTRKLAAVVHECVGGDMVELKTVNACTENYDALTKQAQKEQQDNARPALATELSPFGRIRHGFPRPSQLVGYPPMALFTLREQYDFSGKAIVPFCTRGGSRPGRSVDDIKELCPNASVLKGFSALGNRVDEAASGVDACLHGLGIAVVK